MRSIERSVEEVLLPALELASDRDNREAEREFAFRWGTGWLYASRRVAPPASRSQGVLLFDSSPRLDLESLHVQALELGLRRAGFRTLLLAFDLPPERVVRAIRALDPTAFVFCGGEATLEVVGRLVYTVRQVGSAAPVFEYREAMPVTGDHGIPSLGGSADRGRGAPQGLRRQRPHRAGPARAGGSRRGRGPAPGRGKRSPRRLSPAVTLAPRRAPWVAQRVPRGLALARQRLARSCPERRPHPRLQCRRDAARARRSARTPCAAGAAARRGGRAPPRRCRAEPRGRHRGRVLGAGRAHHRRRLARAAHRCAAGSAGRRRTPPR